MGEPRPPVRNIAVVGTGIGQQHLRALAKLPDQYRIAAVCDLDADAAAKTAEQYQARATTDFESILSDDDIDIIDLTTPPRLHEEQTIASLAAGKDVVCEKPLVGSLASLDRIEAECERTGRRTFPVFNYRFGSEYQRFLRMIEEGDLGDPLVATIEVGFFRGPDYYENPWRGTKAGELGGCMAAHTIHHFDMLLTALGSPFEAMARTATRVNDIETEDCAAGVINFADGALASFAVTLGCVEEYSRLRVVFSNAVVEFGPGPYESITQGEWTIAGVDRPDGVPSGESGFQNMFREIHRALDDEASHAPTLTEARATIELLTGLYQAAAEGDPVAFPIAPSNDWYGEWK